MTQDTRNQIETCQAGVFVAAGIPLEMRRFALPRPSADEALVRIECCTICGSDLHTITGKRTERAPSILGHEILGVVDSVGDPPPCDLAGVPLRPGDRITWSTSVSCGRCDRCQGGLPQKCRALAKYGHELAEGPYALSGGLSEFLLLRTGSTSIRIANTIPAEVICPVNCATATIAAAYRTAGPVLNRRVLILGSGMLGLTACAFAKSEGAATVTVCDVDPRRLERASRFGADSRVEWCADLDELQRRLAHHGKSDLFDVVLELSGSREAVEFAFRVGEVASKIVLVGSVMKSPPAQIDPENVVRRWLSIHGVHNYCPLDLQTAVAFLEKHGEAFPFADLVEFTYPLAEINSAMERAVRDRPFRIAIRP